MEKIIFIAQYHIIEECIRTGTTIKFYEETPEDEVNEVLGILADKCKEILNTKDERLLEIQFKIKKEMYVNRSQNYDNLFMLVYMARKIIAGEPIEIPSTAYGNKDSKKIENTKKLEEPQKVEESHEIGDTLEIEDLRRNLKDGDFSYKTAIKLLTKIKRMLYTESVEKLQEITAEYFKYNIKYSTTQEIEEVRVLGAEVLYLLYIKAKKENVVILLPSQTRMKRILKQALIHIGEINKIPTDIVTELLPFKDPLNLYERVFKRYINDELLGVDKYFYGFLDTVIKIEEIIKKVRIADFTGGDNKYLKLNIK